MRLPNAFLGRGISLVDTPGVGGLNAGHAAATLAFLPSADALVFVTDASAELSGPELEFLASAMRAGPPILVAVTKVDMYPEWRRIVDIDERHLGSMGHAERPFALSSVLRMSGDVLADPALERDSGFPSFAETLVGDVVGRARGLALAAAVAQIGPAIEQLREPFSAELAALDDPAAAERLAADLREVRARLAALGAADASWSVRLEDEFVALRTRIDVRVPGPDAPGRARGARGARTDRSRRRLARPQRADPGAHRGGGPGRLPRGDERGGGRPVDDRPPARRRGDRPRQHGGAHRVRRARPCGTAAPRSMGRPARGFWRQLGVFTGASVGVEMLGMLGTLLGAAIVGPAAIGVALVFGGKGVLGERRRQLADRRQQARTFLAGFVEEVRFEADGRLASLLDEVQRQMRARFADRIRELHRTYTESAAALERAADQAEAERAVRLPTVHAELTALDDLRIRVADLERGDVRTDLGPGV